MNVNVKWYENYREMTQTTKKPGTDYYNFINENWLRDTIIPTDAGSTSISRQIAERIETQLFDIVGTSLKEEPDSPLSRFVKSIYHTWNDSRRTEYVIVELLGRVRGTRTQEDMAYMIGHLNKLQIRSPITLKVITDPYNTRYSRLQIAEYLPCVPHKYLLTDQKYKHEQTEYKKFLTNIGTYFGSENLARFADLEMRIAEHLPSPIQVDNIPARRNQHTLNELEANWPKIPWNSIFEGYGIEKSTLEKHAILVANPSYLKFMETMFNGHHLDELKCIAEGAMLVTIGRFVSGKVYSSYFDFYGRVLRGAESPSSMDRIMLTILTTHLPQLLSLPYTEKYLTKKIKEEAIHLVILLKSAAQKRVNLIEWMTSDTKKKAIDKLTRMDFKVGFPTVWRDESRGMQFSETKLLHNLLSINERDSQAAVRDIGMHEYNKSSYWDSATFEVNAFYYPEYNEMVIPAGILQIPFFDVRKGVAWNLGGIGNVICHEITHGFDTDGRNHDADGNYAPWWSETEDKEYENKAKQIAALFDTEYMGLKINGQLTLMENIADLGGIAIALQALEDVMQKDSIKGDQRIKTLREFFTSYAVSWRNKDRPQKAEHSSRSDRHAPAKLRVNKIVSQFPQFYEAYDIQPGDLLWVAPEKRITIW